MQVTVHQLRHQGEKLPREQLDGPHTGWLRLERFNIGGELVMTAGLYGSDSRGAPPLLDSLSGAVVTQINERGLLVVGQQINPYTHQAWPQAWWCVPVTRGTAC